MLKDSKNSAPNPSDSVNSQSPSILTRLSFLVHSLIVVDFLYFACRYIPYNVEDGGTNTAALVDSPLFSGVATDGTNNTLEWGVLAYIITVVLKLFVIIIHLINSWLISDRGLPFKSQYFPFSLFVDQRVYDDYEQYKMVRFFSVTIMKVAISGYITFAFSPVYYNSNELRVFDNQNNLTCDPYISNSNDPLGCWEYSEESYIVGPFLFFLSLLQVMKDFMLFLHEIQLHSKRSGAIAAVHNGDREQDSLRPQPQSQFPTTEANPKKLSTPQLSLAQYQVSPKLGIELEMQALANRLHELDQIRKQEQQPHYHYRTQTPVPLHETNDQNYNIHYTTAPAPMQPPQYPVGYSNASPAPVPYSPYLYQSNPPQTYNYPTLPTSI